MKFSRAGWLVPLLASLGGVAAADTLTPGGMIVGPAGASVATDPQLAGSVVAAHNTPFSYEGWYEDDTNGPSRITGNVTGSVQSMVVHSNDGSYDFYWRVTLAADAFLPVAHFTVGGLLPSTFDAGWRSDKPGTAQPALISEDAASGAVDFAFGQYIPPSQEIYPGQKSYWLFLDTDAHAYGSAGSFTLESERDSGGDMMIDWGGASGAFQTFAPVWTMAKADGLNPLAPVPEPATSWLALGGLGVLGWLARRRVFSAAAAR
jgi:uncharacterized protein (TIGR03382 family)